MDRVAGLVVEASVVRWHYGSWISWRSFLKLRKGAWAFPCLCFPVPAGTWLASNRLVCFRGLTRKETFAGSCSWGGEGTCALGLSG